MNNEFKILSKNDINEIRNKLGLAPKKYLYTIIKNELIIHKNQNILSKKILT